MADDRSATQVSSFESPESMKSTVTASRPCSSEALSASATGCAEEDVFMWPPEEKLKYFDRRAQAHEERKEFDACIKDLVRCLALSWRVYEDKHVKVAQAHIRLGNAYLRLKGFGLQARQYSSLARKLLPSCPSGSRAEKLEVLSCLLNIHLTHGGASVLTANLEEAESSFLEAEQVLDELHQLSGISQEEKLKTELEISAGLSRVYRRQNRSEEALNQCEKSLRWLKDCDAPEKTCLAYRDMAAIEHNRGHLDRAIEHLSKAHAIAMSHGQDKLEGAQISHSLALVLSAATEPQHNESAGHYFEQSLSAYKNSAGPQDPAFLSAQDDFCLFLLKNGQKEKCVEIQRASLAAKTSTFGDLSAEVADTLHLIGSVEMSEGRVKQAHRTMRKCLQIQSVLYGPQHKKTKATQRLVDMLAQ